MEIRTAEDVSMVLCYLVAATEEHVSRMSKDCCPAGQIVWQLPGLVVNPNPDILFRLHKNLFLYRFKRALPKTSDSLSICTYK